MAGTIMVVGIVLGLIWGAVEFSSRDTAQTEGTPPSIAQLYSGD